MWGIGAVGPIMVRRTSALNKPHRFNGTECEKIPSNKSGWRVRGNSGKGRQTLPFQIHPRNAETRKNSFTHLVGWKEGTGNESEGARDKSHSRFHGSRLRTIVQKRSATLGIVSTSITQSKRHCNFGGQKVLIEVVDAGRATVTCQGRQTRKKLLINIK